MATLLELLKVGATMRLPPNTRLSSLPENGAEVSKGVETVSVSVTPSGGVASSVSVVLLPHCPGAVNYAASTSEVLSGIFTGCIMASYHVTGARRVAHVHTGNDGGPDCKAYFRDLFQQANYNQVGCFKPYDGARDGDAYAPEIMASGSKQPGVFGIITADNKLYSIYCRKESAIEYVVAGVFHRAVQQPG